MITLYIEKEGTKTNSLARKFTRYVANKQKQELCNVAFAFITLVYNYIEQ